MLLPTFVNRLPSPMNALAITFPTILASAPTYVVDAFPIVVGNRSCESVPSVSKLAFDEPTFKSCEPSPINVVDTLPIVVGKRSCESVPSVSKLAFDEPTFKSCEPSPMNTLAVTVPVSRDTKTFDRSFVTCAISSCWACALLQRLAVSLSNPVISVCWLPVFA